MAAKRMGGAAGYSVRVVKNRGVVRQIQLWHDSSMCELFKADAHLLDAALESVHALGLEAKDSAHLSALIQDAHQRRCLK